MKVKIKKLKRWYSERYYEYENESEADMFVNKMLKHAGWNINHIDFFYTPLSSKRWRSIIKWKSKKQYDEFKKSMIFKISRGFLLGTHNLEDSLSLFKEYEEIYGLEKDYNE